MKIWCRSAILLVSMGFTACAHEGKPNETAAPPTAAGGDACREVSQIICTREYAPVSCAMGEQNFSGSNACEARKLAKAYACETKVPFVDAQLKCEGKANVAQNEPIGGDAPAEQCDGDRKPCTREYKPQVCRLGEVTAKGANLCEALNALKTSVCSKKLAFNESQTSCEATNVSPMPTPTPKAKRSR